MDDNQIATSEAELPEENSYEAVEVKDDADYETPHEPGSLQDTVERLWDGASKEDLEKPAAPAEVKAEPTKAVETPEQIAAKPSRAPQSWKPEAKAIFETLPEIAQAEIMRVNQEINTTLARTADDRKLAQAYMQTAGKYEDMYRARGVSSLQAAQQLFEADRVLSTGTATERAHVLAQMIQTCGVGQFGDDFFTELENQILSAGKTTQIDPALNARLQQIEQFTNQQRFAQEQQQRFAQEQEQNTINSSIEQFKNDSKNEFFEQVRHNMGLLISGGAAKDLQDAYDQACYANPEIRKELLQREAANRQRAAAGTSSLPTKGPRNNAPPPSKAQFKDRHAAIAAMYEEAEGGRV